jgi:hypothetical protein
MDISALHCRPVLDLALLSQVDGRGDYHADKGKGDEGKE